jgi:coenzyme F420-reducing hydrogenase beta subunit
LTNVRSEKYLNFKAREEEMIEQQFLKGEKDREIGIFCDLFSAKSNIDGQDGGVVSALLLKSLKEGLLDSAIVVRRMEGYNAEAVVAVDARDILAAKGTKYLRVNVTKKLRELISEGKKSIAIVCTPCEVKVARKIQQMFKGSCEIIVIGLFCFEAFNLAKLRKEVKVRFGVDLDEADKIQVSQGKFQMQTGGKDYSCKVRELDVATENGCSYCEDFTGRFADVSIGSVGSKPRCR